MNKYNPTEYDVPEPWRFASSHYSQDGRGAYELFIRPDDPGAICRVWVSGDRAGEIEITRSADGAAYDND